MSDHSKFQDVDNRVHKLLQDEIDKMEGAVMYSEKSYLPGFLTRLIGVEGFILLILLCLGSFMGYQQWHDLYQT